MNKILVILNGQVKLWDRGRKLYFFNNGRNNPRRTMGFATDDGSQEPLFGFISHVISTWNVHTEIPVLRILAISQSSLARSVADVYLRQLPSQREVTTCTLYRYTKWSIETSYILPCPIWHDAVLVNKAGAFVFLIRLFNSASVIG